MSVNNWLRTAIVVVAALLAGAFLACVGYVAFNVEPPVASQSQAGWKEGKPHVKHRRPHRPPSNITVLPGANITRQVQ